MGLIRINENVKYLGKFRIDEYDIERDKLKKGKWQKNLLTNKFKYGMAEVLVGDYDIDKHTIGNLALGTGTAAVAATDTSLTTQLGSLKSYVVDSRHNSTNQDVAEVTYFIDYTESEYYGTWNELGLYATDETTLLTHALINPGKVFNNSKTMTIHYLIDF